jgi:Tol biopolymer transport system component
VTCAFVHHKTNEGHDLVDINTIANDRKLDITTMIQTVKEKSQAISVVSEKIIEEKKELRLHEEYVYNEIEAVMNPSNIRFCNLSAIVLSTCRNAGTLE